MFKLSNNLVAKSLFLSLLVASNTQAASQYILQDLGQIPAGSGESIHINDAGHYTIPVASENNTVNVLLKTETSEIVIPGFGFAGLQINDLNNNGHAVGQAISDPLIAKKSALYFDGLNSHNIETLVSVSSTANSINNNNEIVGEIKIDDGSTYTQDNPTLAYSYNLTNMNMTLLDDIFIASSPYVYPNMATAKEINDAGVVAGASGYFNGCNGFLSGCEAYTFDGTNLNELGHLATNKTDDVTSIGNNSFAQAINTHGHVAGHSDRIGNVIYTSSTTTQDSLSLLDPITPPPVFYPDPNHVFFHDGTQMKDLGTLSVDNIDASAYVNAMNDSDKIVGYVTSATKRAFVVTPRASIKDLNELIPTGSEWSVLNVATDINNNDVIVGYGIKNGATHAFMLKPATTVDLVCLNATTKACEIVQCKIDGICQ